MSCRLYSQRRHSSSKVMLSRLTRTPRFLASRISSCFLRASVRVRNVWHCWISRRTPRWSILVPTVMIKRYRVSPSARVILVMPGYLVLALVVTGHPPLVENLGSASPGPAPDPESSTQTDHSCGTAGQTGPVQGLVVVLPGRSCRRADQSLGPTPERWLP